jgi:long-chain acyl-CoA synthetase
MEKIWLKSYPPGVSAEIDTTQFGSVADLLERSFREHAAARAFVCMGCEMTYAELDEKSRHLAAWFQAQGLAQGARIAVMLPNLLQYPVAMAAILRAGYIVVNVNPLYTPRELEHQLNDSGAEAIVILDTFAATLQAVQARTAVRHVVVTSIGEMKGAALFVAGDSISDETVRHSHVSLGDAIARGAEVGFTPVRISADDVAVLQYTGGTAASQSGCQHRAIRGVARTGLPKPH